jgi:hypothetical protein
VNCIGGRAMDSTSVVTIARSISASEEHPYQESLPTT